MSIEARRELVREALRAAGFNPTRYTWNESQLRTGTSPDNLPGDEWDGAFEETSRLLRTLQTGEVLHVCVYSRGYGAELRDIVTVVMP